MDRIPKPGEFYRHFKNKMYQVMAVATHSETGEQLVIYQALYGSYGIYARPLENFMSPVDRNKYPDAVQNFRFEKVEPEEEEKKKPERSLGDDRTEEDNTVKKEREEEKTEEEKPETEKTAEKEGEDEKKKVEESKAEENQTENSEKKEEPNPFLLEFLDSDTIEEKLAVLRRMEGCVGKRELDSICVCLDMNMKYESLGEQIEGIRQYLKMQLRYDASRLRRGCQEDGNQGCLI